MHYKIDFLHEFVDHIVYFGKETSQSVSEVILSMVGRRLLTDREYWHTLGQLDVGRRQLDVFANFGVSQSVVSRLYQRYQQTGEVAERRGRGRLQATSAADDRYLLVQ